MEIGFRLETTRTKLLFNKLKVPRSPFRLTLAAQLTYAKVIQGVFQN